MAAAITPLTAITPRPGASPPPPLSHRERYRHGKGALVTFAASPTAETPFLLVRKYLAS